MRKYGTTVKNLGILLFSTLISVSAYSSIIFGPETFNSVDGELKTVVRTINLGDNQPGVYLIKLQNGSNGPGLLQQCLNKTSVELKRQCQYENLVDRIENQLTRVNSFNVTVNGKLISTKSLLNKSSSYLEFPITLNLPVNEVKFSVQGNPEAFVQAQIEDLATTNLPPLALFSLNSNYGRAPFTLKFNAAQSFDPLNKTLSYQWLIDGQPITDLKASTYVFETEGEHKIKLIVTNTDGLTSELEADIVVLPPANILTNKKPIPKILISYPDPLNLRLVKVSALDSYDTDGYITKTVINFGDGTPVVTTNESFHQYTNDGTFIVNIKVTDDQGAVSSLDKSISISLNSQLSKVSSLYGPENFYGSFSSYNDYFQTINITNEETADLYRIRIKNADGKDHLIRTCSGTTAEKIMCAYNNLISQAYIALYRVDYAQVYVNNKKITDSTSINKSQKSFETYLKLSEINQLKIRLKGWPTAYINVEIEKLGEVPDTTAPVLTSNVESGSTVRSNLIHISVEDNSNVTTDVYKDDVLLSTETGKEFDITLTEGLNNFVLRSKDTLNNVAEDFLISNVTLDSTPPIATALDLKAKYVFNTLPQTLTFNFSGNEDLLSATINGEDLTRISANQFQYQLKVFEEGKTLLQLKLKDLVGNISTTNFYCTTVLDTIAPVLSIYTTLPATTKASQITANFRIVEVNDVTTTVKVNGAVVGTSTAKSFNQVLPLNFEGINTIEATSVDGVGNVSNTVTAQIIKDTHGPVLSVNPGNGAAIGALSVNITGTSNEALSSVLINSKAAIISEDKKSFSYTYTSTTYGNKTITVLAKDLLGNATTVQNVYKLQLSSIPLISTNISEGSYTNNPIVQVSVSGEGINNMRVLLDDNELLNENRTSYSFNILSEGLHKVEVIATNDAGKTSSQIYNFTYDQTAPFINVYGMQAYTSEDNLSLGYSIYDISPATLRVFVDQQKVLETTEVQGNIDIPLTTEGNHIISVGAIDQAGNIADIISFETVKDTTPPVITVVSPQNNSYVDGASFKVKVTVDDKDPMVFANGTQMAWNEDEKVWEASYYSSSTDDFPITIGALNQLGMYSETIIVVKPLISPLVPELLGLYEDSINQKVVIKGADGSTKPFLNVNIKSGLFSSTSVQADKNGSFMISLDPKDQYVISVTDPVTGSEGHYTLKRFNQEIILSGIIKDNSNNPVYGVLVSLGADNAMQTYSDQNGVFSFNSSDFAYASLSGSQVLTVDGTTVYGSTINDRPVKFSKTTLNVNLSNKQNNIIQNTIYLYPTFLDEDTLIAANTGGTVSSENAPGVELSIPASATSFPTGTDEEHISMFTVDADKITIAPPASAQASKVVVLEPSGTTFTEPVQMTMPNFSNFPPKTNLVVMLFNSKTGRWEPGGAAVVSDNGQSVTTKEDQGIRHFSMAFAMPPPPDIMTTNVPDQPGADSFSGASSNQIKLPDFKVLGQSVSPGLIYKSAWAKPSTTVTNIFNIPDKKAILSDYVESGTQLVNYQVDFVTCTVGGLFGTDFNKFLGNAHQFLDPAGYNRAMERAQRDIIEQGIYPDNCTPDKHTFYNNIDYTNSYSNLSAVINPLKVEMDFATVDVKLPTKEFKNIPRMAQLSQFVDLKNTQGQYLATGLYPYVARYKVYYEQLITGTVQSSYYSELTGAVKEEPKALDPIVSNSFDQSDLIGSLFVQNYKNSSAGQGWKIAGVQKIVNPGAEKIMLEEADGSITSYSVKNSITTVADGTSLGGDLSKGVSLNMWPNFSFSELTTEANDSNRKIFSASLVGTQYEKSEIGNIAPITGQAFGYTYYNWTLQGQQHTDRVCTHHIPVVNICDVWEDQTWYEQLPRSTCQTNKYPYKIGSSPTSMLMTSNGTYLLDTARSSLSYVSSNGYQRQLGDMYDAPFVAGYKYQSPTNPYAYNVTYDPQVFAQYKDTQPELSYTQIDGRRDTYDQYNACGAVSDLTDTTQGQFPAKGSLNSPMSMVASPADPNLLIIADTGNNRILSYNISTHESQVIAGGINSNDSGDGKYATEASIAQPQGLAFDAAGNIYVSTKMGHIRKISTEGIITTIAGDALNGLYLAEGEAGQMQFNEPYGLAFDNQNNALFVADTGYNRIVKIDLNTNKATTVVGNGQSGFSGDGGPAVDAALSKPTNIALYGGSLIIVDSGNNKIRKVQLNNSSIGYDLTFESSKKDNSQLIRKADSSWQRVYRNGQIEYFNAQGFHVKSKSPNELETNYTYDNGQISKVIFPNNQEMNYNYSAGKLSSIVDPAGRATQFNYNGGGQLTNVYFPDNSQRSFNYSGTGLMTEDIAPNGLSTTYTYNQYDRLEKITQNSNTNILIGDSKSPGLQQVDSSGVFIPRSLGLSSDQASESITDANGNQIKFVKDVDGYISTIVDPRGRTQKIKRDLDGRVTEITDVDGSVVRNTYDSTYGDLIKTENVTLDIVNQKTYNQYGLITSDTDAYGKSQIYEYNSKLQLIKQTYPDGKYVTLDYNALGQIISKRQFSSSGAVESAAFYEYDSIGKLTKQTDLAGKFSTYTYDNAGNVLSSTSYISSGNSATTFYQYDNFNRLTKVTSPNSEVTEYSYSISGDLTEIKDPHDKITTFEYDIKGQLVRKTDSAGNITSFTYDSNGNRITEVDPNNHTKIFSYNSINKVTQVQTADDLILYGYNLKDEVVSIANSTSSVDYIRDAKQRVVQESVTGVSISYPMHTIQNTFTKNDLRTLMQSNFQTIGYGYNSNSYQLISMQNNLGDSYSFGYDDGGRLTQINRPGSQTVYSYDSSGTTLSSIVHSSGGVTKSSFEYQYDLRNYITQKRSPASTLNYTYDSNGQLTSAQKVENSNDNETFTYDAIGNRLTYNNVASTYDSAKQKIQDDGSYTYLYDNNGNVIYKGSKSNGVSYQFDYSALNQLKKAVILSAPLNGNILKTIEYKYDPLGRRIARQVVDNQDNSKSNIKKYYYDGSNILAELDKDNNLTATYVYSPLSPDDILSASFTNYAVSPSNSGSATTEGQVLAASAGTVYYLKDHLNSITDIINSSGNIIQKYDYSSFGEIRSVKNSIGTEVGFNAAPIRTSFTFTGREYEPELGMYYYRARYLDPSTGRFLQQDPDPGKLADPRTLLSKYIYVANSPTMLSDPSGKFIWFIVAAILAGGLIGAGNNMNAAAAAGWSTSSTQFWLSGLLGFVTGGLQTAAGIFGGYPGMILGSALGSALNNIGNQSIFKGSVDWNEAGQAFTGGLFAGVVSAGVFYGVNKYIMPVMISPIGKELGSPLMYPNGANWWSLFAGSGTSYFSAPTGINGCQAYEGGGSCNYQVPQGAH